MSSIFALVTTAITLGVLGIAAWLVPAQIERTAGGGKLEADAQARLQQDMYQELADGSRLDATILIPNEFHEHKAPDIASIRRSEATTEDLTLARYLVAKGRAQESKPYYENYIKTFPDAVTPRIELAKVYLEGDQGHDARLLCLRTLKRQLTSEEIGTVWQLLGQCQTK